jgi:hypothetical protein
LNPYSLTQNHKSHSSHVKKEKGVSHCHQAVQLAKVQLQCHQGDDDDDDDDDDGALNSEESGKVTMN